MAKIIINTTAIRNNGDAALVFTLGASLEARGHTVLIATPHPSWMRETHKRTNVCGEVLGYRFKLFRYPLFSDLGALFRLLLSHPYREADAIIGAPGGYLNSFYGFTWRRAIYRWAHRFGKKVAIYAQSVGPLDRRDAAGLRRLSSEIDLLMTRDALSETTALRAGFAPNRLMASIDAIFLAMPAVSASSPKSDTVAISVREWSFDSRDVSAYTGLIISLAEAVLKRGLSIQFISTCQGVAGYIDDSKLALEIAQQLRRVHGDEIPISVVTESLGVDELKARISTYRMVIGTRLHMCLLALLSGVPAFNISYESKGRECYRYLGLGAWSVDYNAAPVEAVRKLDGFMASEAHIRASLPRIVGDQHARATSDFNAFLARLDFT